MVNWLISYRSSVYTSWVDCCCCGHGSDGSDDDNGVVVGYPMDGCGWVILRLSINPSAWRFAVSVEVMVRCARRRRNSCRVKPMEG